MILKDLLEITEGRVLVHAFNKYGVDAGICCEPKEKFKRYLFWDIFKVEAYNDALFIYVREPSEFIFKVEE